MPIDTQQKRQSILSIGVPWTQTLPVSDGSIDQGDRQHLAHLYSGILAGEEVIPPTGLSGAVAADVALSGADITQFN